MLNIKEIGLMIKKMVLEYINGRMKIYMKEIGNKEKDMVLVTINGKM